jgi:hypothetical protein
MTIRLTLKEILKMQINPKRVPDVEQTGLMETYLDRRSCSVNLKNQEFGLLKATVPFAKKLFN